MGRNPRAASVLQSFAGEPRRLAWWEYTLWAAVGAGALALIVLDGLGYVSRRAALWCNVAMLALAVLGAVAVLARHMSRAPNQRQGERRPPLFLLMIVVLLVTAQRTLWARYHPSGAVGRVGAVTWGVIVCAVVLLAWGWTRVVTSRRGGE